LTTKAHGRVRIRSLGVKHKTIVGKRKKKIVCNKSRYTVQREGLD